MPKARETRSGAGHASGQTGPGEGKRYMATPAPVIRSAQVSIMARIAPGPTSPPRQSPVSGSQREGPSPGSGVRISPRRYAGTPVRGESWPVGFKADHRPFPSRFAAFFEPYERGPLRVSKAPPSGPRCLRCGRSLAALCGLRAPLCSKGAGLLAEALHRLGRVLRLWRVCSDQAHGVLSSIAQYLDCVTVNDAGHLHRPGGSNCASVMSASIPPTRITTPILAVRFDFSFLAIFVPAALCPICSPWLRNL